MRIKNRFSILVLFIIIMAAICVMAISSCSKSTTSENGTVRVAAIINLTGPAAQFDAVKQNTLALAKERIKVLYPTLTFELKVFDAGGGPESTSVAVRKALKWGASYLLSGTSPTALAIASQVRGKKPVVVQMSNAANPDFGPPRIGEYRLWVDWNQEASIIYALLKNEKMSRVLLIHSADPYSTALKEALSKLNNNNSLTFKSIQFDPSSTPDFRPALLRAKQDEMDCLVIFGLPPGLAALISQMAEVDWNKPLIGGVNLNLSVANYDKATLKCPMWLIQTEAMLEKLEKGSEADIFRTEYKKMYNKSPAFHSLYIADGLYMIAAANAQKSSSDEMPVDLLKKVEKFECASGRVDVTKDNDLRFVMSAKKVR